jgi:hypothetical protein
VIDLIDRSLPNTLKRMQLLDSDEGGDGINLPE